MANNYPEFLKQLRIRVNDMEQRRQKMMLEWLDIQTYLLPWHGRNLTGDESETDEEEDREVIFSQAPEDAIDRLAAGFQFSITPRSEPWFSLTMADYRFLNRFVVREYLHEVERRIRHAFSKSNLYDVLHHVYTELIGFGTAAMAELEDTESIIRFKPFTVGEYSISENSRGQVDRFHREMWKTARQMVAEFGEDNVSLSVMEAMRSGKSEQKFRVCQMIEPNDGELKAFGLSGKTYRSVYYEKIRPAEDNKILEIRGFNEFPVMVVRWRVVGDDIWGRSPGMKVLPDVKSLYKISENTLIAIDKVLDPPMVAPGGMKNEFIDSFPGGINFSDEMAGADAFRPLYQIRPDIKSAEYIKEQLTAAIQRGFFNDIFLMLANTSDTKRMTATEVQGRREEKMTMLGPVLGRLQGELLEQLIDRTFSIMNRIGALPPAPREIQGSELKIEYQSILAKAQEMTSVNAMMQMLNFVGALASVKQDVLDKVNADGMLDEFAERMSVPPSAVVPEEQVNQIRKQRQQAQLQQQQLAVANTAVDMAQKAGKTPLQDSTMLDNIMSRVGNNSDGSS